ncbi:MAG: hypothetical protein GX811_00120 [Lentisphaerae bacterium]|nr:hypothetical protein [Lentisphaerota bacterium]
MILHRQWVASAKAVKDLLGEKRGRKRLVLILNGEPIDGDHHDTPQLITKLATEQIDMAIALLDEWLQIVEFTPKRGDCMYLVRGTDAHEAGNPLEVIGRDLDGVVPYRRDTSSITKDGRYTHAKLVREVNGKIFDITHHGFTRGGRAWTRTNSIYHTLRSIYYDALEYGYEIPDFVIRSHGHVYTAETYTGNRKTIHGCMTPGWQLKTHFINRVAANERINTIGMVYYDVLASGHAKHYKEILSVEDVKVEAF